MRLYDAIGIALGTLAAPTVPLLSVTRAGTGLGERLGQIPAAMRAVAAGRPVWIHAASVGEVLAAAPLVDALRARWPERPVVFSTTSLTGRAAAQRLAGVSGAMLLAVDLRCIVEAALRAVAPRALIVMETEIWPALFSAADAAHVPVAIVSGRVSPGAARRYRLAQPFVRAALRHATVLAMQTDGDAERIRALGAPAERVRVIGSLKYARVPSAPASAASATLFGLNGRPVLVAASTQPGEETVVLDACADLWSSYPDCLLIVAPRRPERFDEVDALLGQRQARRQRRSQIGAGVRPDTQVLLLDSVGELPGLLAGARGVFVGGTIADLGGHNLLEPAAAGTAVCFGPHTQNVAEAAAALLASGGGVCVRDAAELRALWLRLLAEPEQARAMGMRARSVIRARAAVLDDTLAVLEPLLA